MTILKSDANSGDTTVSRKIYVETEDFTGNLYGLPEEDVSAQDVFDFIDLKMQISNSEVQQNTTHRQKSTGNPHSVNKEDVELGDVPNTDFTAAVAANTANIAAMMSLLNPIGTIREFNVATNPATLLGFGTWSEYGTGRATVGINSGDTDFDTVDETGGAKTKDIEHYHRTAMGFDGTSNYNWHNALNNPIFGSDVVTAAVSTSTHTSVSSGATRVAKTDVSGSTTQDVMNPYIVVYRWVRTE